MGKLVGARPAIAVEALPHVVDLLSNADRGVRS